MTNWTTVAACACAIFVAQPAHSQPKQTDTSPAGAQAPFVAFGSSASSATGVGVTWPLASKLNIEFETDDRTPRAALSTHVSLLFELPPIGAVRPYLAGGLRVDQSATAAQPRGQGLMLRGTTYAIDAGGGLRVPVNQNWQFRSDARWFQGVGSKAQERWRVYNGVTFGGSQ
jgi:hypothetical protein